MKVLMVTPSYSPIVGGTETFVQQLALKLNGQGISGDVMTCNMNSKWKPEGRDEIGTAGSFRVFRIAAFNPRVFSFRGHSLYGELFNVHVIPRFTFSREFENYDIIHFHDDIDLSLPAFSHFVMANKKPNLLHCHSLPYTYSKYKNYPIRNLLFKKSANCYVGLSGFTVKLLLQLGLPQKKIAELPNAVDTESFKPSSNERIHNVILSVARIGRAKGLDILLRALFHVKIPTVTIIIGPVNDPVFFSEVKAIIRELEQKTVHKVTYLGIVDEGTLIGWYQKASVFVCPSISDHFPISILEALACGASVVASNVGAIPDIIEDGVNGSLVPPSDYNALSKTINDLLENRAKRELYGINGRETVTRCFSWEVVLGRLIQIYKQILA
jgi:glycosyltransferase involved in cell wall biosynthesis